MRFLITSRSRLDAGSLFLVARDIAGREEKVHGHTRNGDSCIVAEWCFPWARPSTSLLDGYPVEHRINLEFDVDDIGAIQIFEGLACVAKEIHFQTEGGMYSHSLQRIIGQWAYEAREAQEESIFKRGMSILAGRR